MKKIVLNSLFSNCLTAEQESSFIAGCLLYETLTAEGKTAVSKEKARSLTDNEIQTLISALMFSSLDFEIDTVAFDSLQNIVDVSLEREPAEFDTKKSLAEFKKKYSNLFRE